MNDRNGVEMESTHLLIGFYAGHHKENACQGQIERGTYL